MRVVRFALVGKTLRDVLIGNGRLRNPQALHLFKRGHEKRGMMLMARILKHLVHAGVRIVPRNNAPAVFDDARFFVGNFFARRA